MPLQAPPTSERPSPPIYNTASLANHSNEELLRQFMTITMMLDAFSIRVNSDWPKSSPIIAAEKVHKRKIKQSRTVTERFALEALSLLLVRNREIVAVASAGYTKEKLHLVASVRPPHVKYIPLANPQFGSVPEEWHVHYPSDALESSHEVILADLMASMVTKGPITGRESEDQ